MKSELNLFQNFSGLVRYVFIHIIVATVSARIGRYGHTKRSVHVFNKLNVQVLQRLNLLALHFFIELVGLLKI